MRQSFVTAYHVAREIDRFEDEYLTALNDWFSTDIDDALVFDDPDEAAAEAERFGARAESFQSLRRVFGAPTDLGPSKFAEAAE